MQQTEHVIYCAHNVWREKLLTKSFLARSFADTLSKKSVAWFGVVWAEHVKGSDLPDTVDQCSSRRYVLKLTIGMNWIKHKKI